MDSGNPSKCREKKAKVLIKQSIGHIGDVLSSLF